ncbi:MAG: DUF3772 domain-containing protein [Caulobacteraceae bacterium]|nr:DUF3772 domain-containing protein [Caulobacteraceae bacterium]
MRSLLGLLICLLIGGGALAQTTPLLSPAPVPPTGAAADQSGAPATMAALEAEVDRSDQELHELSKSFGAASLTDAQIQQRLAAIPPIQARLADALSNLSPRLAAVDARLAQLGPAPAAGQPPESAEITQNRRTLATFRQTVDGEVKQAKLLQVEASQLVTMLASRQRQQLTAQLWAQSRSILDPALWGEFATALPKDLARLGAVFADERDAITRAGGRSGTLWEWAGALIIALALAAPLRIVLNRIAVQRVGTVAPGTRLRRTLLALAKVLVAIATPLAALLLVRGVLAGAGAITPIFEQMTTLVIRVVVFASFFEGLGRALLSPGRASWRLAPIPDAVVARLRPYPGVIGVSAALATLARGLSTILGSSQPTSAASDCLTVLIEIIAVALALGTMGRARNDHLTTTVAETTPHEAESRLPWIIAALLAWLTLGAALVAVLLGYVQMAFTLMAEMVWIATVLASLFLLLRFVDDLFPAILAPDRPIGQFLRIAIGLSKTALEQISVLLSGVCRLALYLFGWAAILAPFGAGAGDIFTKATSSQLVIKIGQVTISPGAILGAIAVLVLGLIVTRAVRGWLEKRYLPKTRIDLGLQVSLASGVTYLGAFVAVLLTFGYLGLSFDKIALFASALSVGIGFGLQSVIGNFVSGLILLAERPIKVGDWIAIGDLEGDVKRINVRATEIEMWDRSKLIVPNSDLISKTVRNVTQSNALGRVRIVLKTADNADPEGVRELILARLNGHHAILKEPPPAVFLSNVGDGALEFTAFAYVASPRLAYATRSELLFQIVPDLRARNISLASSTPIFNVAMSDHLIQPEADTPK